MTPHDTAPKPRGVRLVSSEQLEADVEALRTALARAEDRGRLLEREAELLRKRCDELLRVAAWGGARRADNTGAGV